MHVSPQENQQSCATVEGDTGQNSISAQDPAVVRNWFEETCSSGLRDKLHPVLERKSIPKCLSNWYKKKKNK